jgi:hypothetical protein
VLLNINTAKLPNANNPTLHSVYFFSLSLSLSHFTLSLFLCTLSLSLSMHSKVGATHLPKIKSQLNCEFKCSYFGRVAAILICAVRILRAPNLVVVAIYSVVEVIGSPV